jgi:type II secretion system (T2SS) protein M
MSLVDRVSSLPPRAQRALAVLFVPAAFLAISASVFWPTLHAYRSQTEWRHIAAHTLARQRGLAGIEPAVREELTALPRLESWQRFYRGAQGTAAIALQSDISGALATSHARPQSFTPIAATAVGPLMKVGLRVAAAMTIDQLRELLHQVDTLRHFVRIEHLIIVAPPSQRAEENPVLTVTFEAFGFGIDEDLANAVFSTQSEHH